MIERCLLCEREWHVSVFRDLRPYYCPICSKIREREHRKSRKRKSTHRSRSSRQVR